MAIFDLVVVTSTRDATNVYKYKRHGVSKSDIAIGHLGTSGRLARHRLVARPLFSSRGYVADGDGDVRVGRLLHSKSNCPPSSSLARSDGSDGIFGKGGRAAGKQSLLREWFMELASKGSYRMAYLDFF